MVWLCLGLRALVNVEALNMAESIGNFIRHRKAGIVVRTQSGYVLRFVPAVSGETLAHAYQSWLAKLAIARGMSVCQMCGREEFVKHAMPELFGSSVWEQKLKEVLTSREGRYGPEGIEATIVSNCVVEDIGGFLLAAAIPVKRSSRFICGYMVPAVDAIDKVVVEPQLHVRHSPSLVRQQQAQMIYYVEVGSGIYTWGFGMDLISLSRSSYTAEYVVRDVKERLNRVELAIDALTHMLETKIFGAKLSRFNPVIDYENVFIVVSKNIPFNVSSPARKDYIEDTIRRANTLKEKFKYEFSFSSYTNYVDEAERLRKLNVAPADTTTSAMSMAKEVAIRWLRERWT